MATWLPLPRHGGTDDRIRLNVESSELRVGRAGEERSWTTQHASCKMSQGQPSLADTAECVCVCVGEDTQMYRQENHHRTNFAPRQTTASALSSLHLAMGARPLEEAILQNDQPALTLQGDHTQLYILGNTCLMGATLDLKTSNQLRFCMQSDVWQRLGAPQQLVNVLLDFFATQQRSIEL